MFCLGLDLKKKTLTHSLYHAIFFVFPFQPYFSGNLNFMIPLHMISVFTLCNKSLVAMGAIMRPCIVMCPFMATKMRFFLERFVANIARERFFPCVCPLKKKYILVSLIIFVENLLVFLRYQY